MNINDINEITEINPCNIPSRCSPNCYGNMIMLMYVNVLYRSSDQTLDGSRWKYIGLESKLLH